MIVGDEYVEAGHAGFAPRKKPFYARGEYLLFFTKGAKVPPLATTSRSGTPQEDAGVLGLNTTSILFGDEADYVQVAGPPPSYEEPVYRSPLEN